MPRNRSLLVGLALAAAAAAGCGGAGVSGPGILRVNAPWDKPLRAPPTEKATMHWAVGEVTAVSLDGGTLHVRLTRGMVSRDARVGVYLATPENPSPHYMWDETRELRAAEAKVVAVSGNRFEAEVVENLRNTRISAGDKVVELVP